MAAAVTAKVLLAGLEQARDRMMTAAQGLVWEPVYFAAFEVLHWATALDDHLAQPRTGNAKTDDHLNALRFTRNRVNHQWADALDLDTTVTAYLGVGVLGRMQLGRTSASFPWRPAHDLPSPSKPSYANPKGEAAYKRVFEGREAPQTIEFVAKALRAATWNT